MKRTLRWLWVSVTIVSLVMVIAIAFTPAGSGFFAGRIEAYLKAKSGAPIEIDGGLFVSHVFSRPAVGMTNIRLYQTPAWSEDTSPLLRAERFEVRVAPQLPSSETGLFRLSDVVFSNAELVVDVDNETGIDLSALRRSWTALTKSSPNYVDLVDIGRIQFQDLKIVFVRSGEFDPIEVHVPKLVYDMDERGIAVHLIPEDGAELVRVKFYEEEQGTGDDLSFRIDGQFADLSFIGRGEIDEISPLRLKAQLEPEETSSSSQQFSLRVAENQNGSYVSVFSGYVSGANVNGTLITPSFNEEAFSLELKSTGEMQLGKIGGIFPWQKRIRSLVASGPETAPLIPINVVLDVDMEAVSIDGTRAAPLKLVLHGDDEKTELVDASIGIGEGVATGSALMEWSDIPQLTVQMDADGLPLEDFGRLLNIDFQTTAKSIVAAKLSSSGSSPEQLLTDLHGEMTVALFDGTFSGLSKNTITAHLVGADDEAKEDTVNVNCFVGAFDLIEGKALSRLVYLDTDKSFSSGSGFIDFDARTVDIELRPRPKDPRQLTQAMDIFVTGSMDTPDVVYKTKRVARGFSSFSAGLASSTVTAETLSQLEERASGKAKACVGVLLG